MVDFQHLRISILQSLSSRSRRDRFLRSYDKIDFHDAPRPRTDQLLADFQHLLLLLLQINGDFRSKEESLHSSTPVGVQIEHLPTDFTYV